MSSARKSFGCTTMKPRRAAPLLLVLSGLTFCACSTPPSEQAADSDSDSGPVLAPSAEPTASSEGGAPDAHPNEAGSADSSLGLPQVRFETATIHRAHRAIPNVMFGGWGPHLGHLVQHRTSSGDETWFVDDSCEVGKCDVNRNTRLDYFKLGTAGFQKVASVALPAGVQQNTATIVVGGEAHSYGVDVASARLVECKQSLLVRGPPGSCTAILPPLEAGSNYVGAAISPKGVRVAWLTHVVDGGGGAFSFFVDYSGGWNGPRRGGIGGFNDVSYINVAFGRNGSDDAFSMHGQLVGGLGPNWSFFGATGTGDLSSATPVSWATDLAGPSAPPDPVVSTNDVAIDPVTFDEHIVARSRSGAAAYYFRARGQSAPSQVRLFPKSYRARLVFLADGALALVRSDDGNGLVVQLANTSVRAKGRPVEWGLLPEYRPMLPPGYENIYAIYPATSVYQRFSPRSVEVALVGRARENEVLYVEMTTANR